MAGIKRFEIKASRWPWQRRTSSAILSDPKTEGVGSKYGWRGTNGMGRFGGGWNWSLGFQTGGWRDTGITLHFDLLFGSINIRIRTRKGVDQERRWQEDAKRRRLEREDRERQEAERKARMAEIAAQPRSVPIFDDNDIPF